MNRTDAVGYAHLNQQCKVDMPPSRSVAVLEKWRGAGRKVVPAGATLVLPFESIPENARLIDHVLVALRYEGVDLAILGESLKQVHAADILDVVQAAPAGEYVRRAAYLWEHFNKASLEDVPAAHRRNVKLFDPKDYYTRTKGQVDPKWGVEFNGLGNLAYCPMIKRDQRLDDADALLWANYDAFIKQWSNHKEVANNPRRLFKPKGERSILARTMRHAFLDETESSFRIESEEPSGNKKEQFVQLLRNAHEGQVINEDFLASMQRFCVDGRWHEYQYRNKQNWLGNGSRNLSSRISYIPPPSELVPDMMASLCDLINQPGQNDVPAIAQAGMVSLGFVFIHPFLDGNGRISRYLAHQTLCNTGKLPHGLVLPLSSAILDEQETYLAALTDFSAPMRTLWDISPSNDPDIPQLSFNGSALSYQFWDAAPSAAFMADMGHVALDEKLVQESVYLKSHDECQSRIQDLACQLPDKEMAKLIQMAVFNAASPGSLSKSKRKQFAWIGDEQLAEVESVVKASFADYFEMKMAASGMDDPALPRERQ